MRHGKKFNHLSRKSAHRKAMLANMASSLILHKRIKTTEAKAKALKMYIEPLITKSKDDSTHSRRIVFSNLQNKEAVTELFREISQKVLNRPGGYTRILKTGNRLGDAAEMCYIELVDYNENLLKDYTVKPKSSRRKRRSSKGTGAQIETATDVTVEETLDTVTVEESIEKNYTVSDNKTNETVKDNKEIDDKEKEMELKADTNVEAKEEKRLDDNKETANSKAD